MILDLLTTSLITVLSVLIYFVCFWKFNFPKNLTRDGAKSKEKFMKYLDNGKIPPIYPNGWFSILKSSALKMGQVKHVAMLGRNRTKSGEVRILNAYCPHLGANLAEGGVIKDDELEFTPGASVEKLENVPVYHAQKKLLVEIPPNATDVGADVEHRLAYWREDIGMNLYHWHWHIYHPFTGPPFIVSKDKRGELFYYFHQQLIARYNVERVCNGLNFVPSSFNWDAPLAGAYFPMLSSDVAGIKWSPRPPNLKLSNIDKPNLDGGIKLDIKVLKRFTARILEAISRKRIIHANGTEISIDNDKGIDILGNMVEASDLSPNADYYGDLGLHNHGHLAIGFVHDPRDEHPLLPAGVMLEPRTAMRDPIFFRWHVFLNDIFVRHKNSLRAHDEQILSFPEVQVTNVELCSRPGGKCGEEKNSLYTYMMKSDINMSRGVDLFPRNPLLVRVTHQNHDDFDYAIEYVNRSPRYFFGTVRIFLIPVIGSGNDNMKLSKQRHLAIEMDRFVQPLKPGRNRIVRKSIMSSMTIPFDQTFRDLDTNRPKFYEFKALDKFNACGCGLPHNLLVPRGTAKGYPMLLFAMITDYSKDRTNLRGVEDEKECRISLFCASRHKKYPYKLPSGFPFDRPIRNGVDTIQAFLTPNMAIKPITIFHSDKVRQGRVLSNAKPTILGSGRQQTDS